MIIEFRNTVANDLPRNFESFRYLADDAFQDLFINIYRIAKQTLYLQQLIITGNDETYVLMKLTGLVSILNQIIESKAVGTLGRINIDSLYQYVLYIYEGLQLQANKVNNAQAFLTHLSHPIYNVNKNSVHLSKTTLNDEKRIELLPLHWVGSAVPIS